MIDRQHRALRRDRRPRVLPRPRGRALRGAQLGRERGRRGRRRPRLRVHDRRPRRHPRPDRAQLRRRHERRRRLRARRATARSATRCNMELVGFDAIDEADAIELHELIEEHHLRTRSPVAARILRDWDATLPRVREGHAARLQARAGRAGGRAARDRAGGVDRRRGFVTTERSGLMGKLGGFLEIARVEPPERDPQRAHGGLPRVRRDAAGRGPARAGRALHGVRRAVLPQRLPARQPDPGLERPRLPRPLARGDRPAARDQQLPGVHRPALPGAVRGRLRAGDPRGRRGLDQADRGLDRQPRVGRGLDRAAAARGRDRPHGRGDRRRPGGPGRRAAAAPRRPRGHGLRARRGRRRAGPLRRAATSRSRSGSSSAGSTSSSAEGVRVPRTASTSASTSTPTSCARRTTRSSSPPARASRATCRSPAASSTACTSRWSTSTTAPAGARGQRRRRRRRSPRPASTCS